MGGKSSVHEKEPPVRPKTYGYQEHTFKPRDLSTHRGLGAYGHEEHTFRSRRLHSDRADRRPETMIGASSTQIHTFPESVPVTTSGTGRNSAPTSMNYEMLLTVDNQSRGGSHDLYLADEMASYAVIQIEEAGFSREEIRDTLIYIKQTLPDGKHKMRVDKIVNILLTLREEHSTSMMQHSLKEIPAKERVLDKEYQALSTTQQPDTTLDQLRRQSAVLQQQYMSADKISRQQHHVLHQPVDVKQKQPGTSVDLMKKQLGMTQQPGISVDQKNKQPGLTQQPSMSVGLKKKQPDMPIDLMKKQPGLTQEPGMAVGLKKKQPGMSVDLMQKQPGLTKEPGMAGVQKNKQPGLTQQPSMSVDLMKEQPDMSVDLMQKQPGLTQEPGISVYLKKKLPGMTQEPGMAVDLMKKQAGLTQEPGLSVDLKKKQPCITQEPGISVDMKKKQTGMFFTPERQENYLSSPQKHNSSLPSGTQSSRPVDSNIFEILNSHGQNNVGTSSKADVRHKRVSAHVKESSVGSSNGLTCRHASLHLIAANDSWMTQGATKESSREVSRLKKTYQEKDTDLLPTAQRGSNIMSGRPSPSQVENKLSMFTENASFRTDIPSYRRPQQKSLPTSATSVFEKRDNPQKHAMSSSTDCIAMDVDVEREEVNEKYKHLLGTSRMKTEENSKDIHTNHIGERFTGPAKSLGQKGTLTWKSTAIMLEDSTSLSTESNQREKGVTYLPKRYTTTKSLADPHQNSPEKTKHDACLFTEETNKNQVIRSCIVHENNEKNESSPKFAKVTSVYDEKYCASNQNDAKNMKEDLGKPDSAELVKQNMNMVIANSVREKNGKGLPSRQMINTHPNEESSYLGYGNVNIVAVGTSAKIKSENDWQTFETEANIESSSKQKLGGMTKDYRKRDKPKHSCGTFSENSMLGIMGTKYDKTSVKTDLINLVTQSDNTQQTSSEDSVAWKHLHRMDKQTRGYEIPEKQKREEINDLAPCNIVVGKEREDLNKTALNVPTGDASKEQDFAKGDNPANSTNKFTENQKTDEQKNVRSIKQPFEKDYMQLTAKRDPMKSISAESKSSPRTSVCKEKPNKKPQRKQKASLDKGICGITKGKETHIYLKMWSLLKTEEDVLISFIDVIADVKFSIKDIQCDSKGGTTVIDIMFPSVNMSETFCNQLKSKREQFKTRFHISPTRTRKDKKCIESQLEHVLKTAAALLEKHQQLQKEVDDKLDETAKFTRKKGKTKFMPLRSFEQRNQEKIALEDKREEYKSHRREFQNCLAGITEKLDILTRDEAETESLREIIRDFDIECSRLKDPLPMYAKRSEIVDLVQENQVSIILGETGSGKSTQLTQYLYQANLGAGLIVCTQPRKVAAMSLATRVAAEMKTSVGHVVGYQVGMKSKTNSETKIVYMTDHLLLNQCLEDHLLQKCSCIIIDEAHERSIYTDLLLGMIKAILPLRPELRVVVTSATINPAVFVEYFGECPVLRVSGRVFPVAVEYCPGGSEEMDDYEERAQRKALEIHASQPPGDILVFLTSQLEIERSIQKMEAYLQGQRNAVIMPLHGKLHADEQSRVFSATPKGKRKIVFATNVAETSLTIPGVKYVVDSGYVKEMNYDPNRKISSLDVMSITKSSAEQRKGRAGRTDVGKCYRLYSVDTYEGMKEITAPEIMRVHLGHAILKLLQLDVNPMEFDFVEAPRKDFLDSAYESLQQIGSVCDGKITAKGKWIAKLPLSPTLGSLVYDSVMDDGRNPGIGLEGIVLAACCTSGGSLFYRAGTVEQKREADKLKVPFCHNAGDHLTYLNVFREWHAVEETKKGKWCKKNSVNGKAIRGVRETVNEILHILKKELDINIKFLLPENPTNDSKLQTFIFRAFMSNVCYFLGHQKAGYHFIDKSQQVVMHPSSAFESLGSLPEWIIIEQVMRTSRDFALNVTAVKEEDIMDAIAKGFMKFDIDQVKSRRLEPACTEYVGSKLHRDFVGPRYSKVKNLEDELCTLHGDVFVVEADRSKGEISIYATKENKQTSQSSLEEIMSPMREKIKLETVDIPLSKRSDVVRATIGPGSVTCEICCPNEYKTVHVYKMECDEYDETCIWEYMERFGKVQDVTTKSPNNDNPKYWGRVTFTKSDTAKAAVAALKENSTKIWTKPSVKISIEQNSFRARISWCRRRGRGFGFVQLHDMSLISSLFNRHHIPVGATPNARITRAKASDDQLHIAGFNEFVDEDVLKESIKDAIGAEDADFGRVTVIREKVTTSPEMMQTFKRRLKVEIEKYARPGSFRIELQPPKDGHTTYRGCVTFNDPQDGNRACQNMDRVFTMNDHAITMTPELDTSVYVNARIFRKVEAVLKKKIEQRVGSLADISFKQLRNNDYIIKIHSSRVDELGRAKSDIEKIVKGDTLEYDQRVYGGVLFSRQGRDKVKKIMEDTDTEVVIDERNMLLSIHGTSTNRRLAMVEVRKYLHKIRHSHSHTLELRGTDKPVGYMKAVIVKYGADLSALRTEFNLQSVDLNHRLHRLVVVGEEENVQKCASAIRELGNEVLLNRHDMLSTGTECGTCFCEIMEDELYRLESCGHPYCLDCVKSQVLSATQNKDFPLKCCLENCGNEWAWQDMIAMIKRGYVTKEAVVNASVSDFVARNKDKHRFCLTPDCPLVYKVSKTGDIFKCPECEMRMCTSCHVEDHSGLSCAMYQASNGNDDTGVMAWMQKDPANRKLCPNCSQCIEKVAGCQKMECQMCHTFICWNCLASYKTSQECYAHLAKVHGSFV